MRNRQAAAAISEIGDLLEREKRYRQRQYNILERQRRGCGLVKHADQKVGVFEIPQKPQVKGHADPEDGQGLMTFELSAELRMPDSRYRSVLRCFSLCASCLYIRMCMCIVISPDVSRHACVLPSVFIYGCLCIYICV